MPIKFKRRSKKRSGIMSLVEQYTPKEFVLKTMNIYILQHSKKYNLTTWNAYMKLSEQKAFKSLMRKWFDNEVKLKVLKIRKKSEHFIKIILSVVTQKSKRWPLPTLNTSLEEKKKLIEPSETLGFKV